jgi:uncharacterized protein GlcG (DUF336 family)
MAATFERPSVTTELAKAMIEAAERKAAEMGHPFVIAVVDESGVLKAFSRMDGAPLLSVQVAQDKAYTAVGFGMATDAWHDFVKDDPPLAMGSAAGTRPRSAARWSAGSASAAAITARTWTWPRPAYPPSPPPDPCRRPPGAQQGPGLSSMCRLAGSCMPFGTSMRP